MHLLQVEVEVEVGVEGKGEGEVEVEVDVEGEGGVEVTREGNEQVDLARGTTVAPTYK